MNEQETALNAKLQQKKSQLRKILNERGIQPKDKVNKFDNYSYFSEAGYKQLFTELFSKCGLELTASINSVERYTADGKMPNGRIIAMTVRLSDVETGFYEETQVFGEGLDKGDKALYKAYTGAIKYYLADNFLVATGDDPEKDSPEASEKQHYQNIELELNRYNSFIDEYFAKKPELQDRFLAKYNISKLNELDQKISLKEIDELITNLKADLRKGDK